MNYKEIVVEASDFKREKIDNQWQGRFSVRVLSSPMGEMAPEQAMIVTYNLRDLKTQLDLLESRDLDKDGLIALGRTLALLLLPPGQPGADINVRDLFADNMKARMAGKALRLKLRLPVELAVIPWEYMYVDRAGGGEGMDGFLALDPGVSIVRHESLPAKQPATKVSGDITALIALAENPNLIPLDLQKEKEDLQQALSDHAGLKAVYLDDATLDEIQATIPGVNIFHFAGHGAFNRQMNDAPGTYSGTGALALADQLVDAETLGINLRSNGIRLAVLGGCETGRREGISVWSGIAPALVKAEIPAVIANQYKILDTSAIAFSNQFYRALLGGLSIERALVAGRIATFNADKGGRDWGVPILYLRADDSELFEGASDTAVREQARHAAEADISIRVQHVAASGTVLGADVGEMLAGKLAVNIIVTNVDGSVIAGKFEKLTGGNVKVNMEAEKVTGNMTGLVIGQLGERRDQ